MSMRNLPPGPPRKCLVGNMSDVDPDRLHVSLTDISERYGDVFSLQISGKTLVVLNSLEAFRELYEENKYEGTLDGREKNFASQYLTDGMDIPLAQNTEGRRKRRAAMQNAMTAFTQQHGHKLQEEISHLVAHVGSKGDDPQDLSRPVTLYITNACLTVLTGQRYSYDDPRLELVVERSAISQTLLRPRVNATLTMFPCLRFLPCGYGGLYRRYVSVTQTFQETVFGPAKNSYHSSHLRGGIDQLLRSQKETLGDESAELNDDYLSASALSVVAAGTAVSIGNFLYFIVVILNHPEIAEKIRDEMDSVIGKFRAPTLADRPQLTYAEAVVLELLRWGSPAPLLVPRRTDEEIQFRGYTIPKDATIITNAWKILHDERLWKLPWEFRPERFIDTKGGILRERQKNVIAFGGGRRKCIGVDLTHDLAFLFVTSLVQRFEFEVAEGKVPTLDPHFSTTLSAGIRPEPFKVIVKPRPV